MFQCQDSRCVRLCPLLLCPHATTISIDSLNDQHQRCSKPCGMCLKTRFAFALLALVSAAMAFSAPPPNDNFADRIIITLDRLPPDSLATYGGSVGGSNVDATKEPG